MGILDPCQCGCTSSSHLHLPWHQATKHVWVVCVVSYKDFNNTGFRSVDSVYRVLLPVILALDSSGRDGVQVEDDLGALLCAVQRPHSSLSPLPKVGT